jgi:hypothetical protein
MKTEKQKMLAGALYDPYDAQLVPSDGEDWRQASLLSSVQTFGLEAERLSVPE